MSSEEVFEKVKGIIVEQLGVSDTAVTMEASFIDDLGAIPLDRHDIEICYLNGIISKSKLSEKEISLLSTSLIECGKKLGLSPSIVDKYLWEVGNSFCNKKSCLNCPLNRTCNTKIY